jgi:hypothetical protein
MMTRYPLRLALFFILAVSVSVQAQDQYLEARVKLATPKKPGKRSEEGGLKHAPFRLWLPGGVKTIRGLVVNPFYTKAVEQKHWQTACRQWGFGIMAANFFGATAPEFPAMVDTALTDFANQANRSELAQAKLCPVGMSSGAGMSTRLAELMPDRVIAAGPVCLEVGPRDAASMNIPMLTVFGERDGKQYEKLMIKLAETRGQQARFGIAVQWRRRHEFARANNLLMPLFDAAIRQRLQEPGQPLKPFPEKQGWLGDVSNWRNGEAKIGPFNEFKGDRSKACWFPDETTARAWQAFVTREPVLKLKSPPGLGDGQPLIVHKTGQNILVEIRGTPKTNGPVEVYAGTKKAGQLVDGKLEIQFSAPGIYPLYLQGESEAGKLLRSRPNTLLVESP